MITIETIDANTPYPTTPDCETPTAIVLVTDRSNADPAITKSALNRYRECDKSMQFVMDSSDFQYAIRRMTTTKLIANPRGEIGRTVYTVSDNINRVSDLLNIAPHARICTPLLLNVIEDVEEDLVTDDDADYNDFKLAVKHGDNIPDDLVMRLVGEIAGYAGVETNITMYGDDEMRFANLIYMNARTQEHHKGHLLKPIIGKALMSKYAVFYPKED